MSPSIFINAKNIFLHQLPGAAAGITLESAIASTSEGFTAGDIATAQADGFRRGQQAQSVFNETRDLGNGERITQKEALAELAKLGDDWRLETPHELFAQVDYGHKNQNGAYSRDESLKDGYYWTSQETPWYEGGRVVVGFDYGLVNYLSDLFRAFARAVRVSGQ